MEHCSSDQITHPCISLPQPSPLLKLCSISHCLTPKFSAISFLAARFIIDFFQIKLQPPFWRISPSGYCTVWSSLTAQPQDIPFILNLLFSPLHRPCSHPLIKVSSHLLHPGGILSSRLPRALRRTGLWCLGFDTKDYFLLCETLLLTSVSLRCSFKSSFPEFIKGTASFQAQARYSP